MLKTNNKFRLLNDGYKNDASTTVFDSRAGFKQVIVSRFIPLDNMIGRIHFGTNCKTLNKLEAHQMGFKNKNANN